MEGRSLLKGSFLLLVLALLRIAVDQVSEGDSGYSSYANDLPELLSESQSAREEQERRTAPLAPDEVLDPNRCGEEELDRLPGIGPATANALVVYRNQHGGFRTAEDLLNVTGIGPATLEKIRGHLDFTSGVPRDLFRRNAPMGEPGNSGVRLDLNRATAEELQSLPGIGPALAQRVLESRRREGFFKTADDLLRVSGIGPATLERIRDLVTPRR